MKWHQVKHVQLATNWQKNPIFLTTVSRTSDLGEWDAADMAAVGGN